MSPAGRPIKEDSRKCNLSLRLTKDEKDRIQKCAERLSMTRTDTIMKGIKMVEDELDKK